MVVTPPSSTQRPGCLRRYAMFFTVRDPLRTAPVPSNATSTCVFGTHGKQRLTPQVSLAVLIFARHLPAVSAGAHCYAALVLQDYMKLQAAFQPDAFGSLSDELPVSARSASREPSLLPELPPFPCRRTRPCPARASP